MAITPARLCTACWRSLSPIISHSSPGEAASGWLAATLALQGQRMYSKAFRSPSVKKQSRAADSGGRSTSVHIFSESDVPPMEFWEHGIAVAQAEGLTAGECMEAARRYCSVATNSNSAWKGKLERDLSLPVYKLHYTALMLLSGAPSERWRLGLHMMGTVSELGYVPSTLTLARVLMRARPGSKAATSGPLHDAEARWRELVRRGRDPDALTLQGLVLAQRGEDGPAMKWFEEAERVGRQRGRPAGAAAPAGEVGGEDLQGDYADHDAETRPFKWTWEASCLLGRGRILLKHGRRDEAEAAFRTVALELDNPDGYLELAKVLPPDAPEREGYLTRAALSGNKDACGLLGELERKKAESALAERKDDAATHLILAREWSRLADREALPAGDT